MLSVEQNQNFLSFQQTKIFRPYSFKKYYKYFKYERGFNVLHIILE